MLELPSSRGVQERWERRRWLSPLRALLHAGTSFHPSFGRGKGKSSTLTCSCPDKDAEDASAAGRSRSTAGKGAGERCFHSEGRQREHPPCKMSEKRDEKPCRRVALNLALADVLRQPLASAGSAWACCCEKSRCWTARAASREGRVGARGVYLRLCFPETRKHLGVVEDKCGKR